MLIGRYATVSLSTWQAPQAHAHPGAVSGVGGRVFSVSGSVSGASSEGWEGLVRGIGDRCASANVTGSCC